MWGRELALAEPHGKAELGFGADDLVKVTRAEIDRVTGEEGIISPLQTLKSRAWDIAVKNLHKIPLPSG